MWAKKAGDRNQGSCYPIDVDIFQDGSCVVTGDFSGPSTFGWGEANEIELVSYGSLDMFAARYDPDGVLMWAKRAGGASGDVGNGVSVLSDGSLILTGAFGHLSAFGLGEVNETYLTSYGLGDVFVARFGEDGILEWVKQAGGNNGDSGKEIAVLPDGSSVVVGYFQSYATFGPGEANEIRLIAASIDSDVFLARLLPDGSLEWVRRAGGSDRDSVNGLAMLPDNSMVLTGACGMDAVFGPGESNETILPGSGGQDIFVARYFSDGDLAWARSANGPGSQESGTGIAVMLDGSSVVSGYYDGDVVFGEGEPNEEILLSGHPTMFLARYNADGTLAWAKSVESRSLESGYPISGLPDGSFIVAGDFNTSITFGPGEENETVLVPERSSENIFLARYDGDGTLLWAKIIGSCDEPFCALVPKAMQTTADGDSVVITGYFRYSARFGANETNETLLTSETSTSTFIVKLGL